MFGIGTPRVGDDDPPQENSPRTNEQITSLRRPPSYSDSFFVLHGAEPLVHQQGSLNSARSRASSEEDEGQVILGQLLQQIRNKQQNNLPIAPRAYLFLIKTAIHIFLVSIFETVFFFQYVSKREDNGVLDTINTYYAPLVDTCPSWSNETRQIVVILLKDMDYHKIEWQGSQALLQRQASNEGLLGDSLVASGICFLGMLVGVLILKRKKIPVRWWVIGVENLSMVIVLGIYEFLFFHYVIYKYSTISTPELNSYIVQGLASCVGS